MKCPSCDGTGVQKHVCCQVCGGSGWQDQVTTKAEQTVMPTTTLPPVGVQHNVNPPTSAMRTLRGLKALLPAVRRLVEKLDTLVAECEVHLADPVTAELLADGFVNVAPRKVEP